LSIVEVTSVLDFPFPLFSSVIVTVNAMGQASLLALKVGDGS